MTNYTKDVRLNRDTKDWDAYVTVDGVSCYLGSRATRSQAERLVDEYAFELLRCERQSPRRAA